MDGGPSYQADRVVPRGLGSYFYLRGGLGYPWGTMGKLMRKRSPVRRILQIILTLAVLAIAGYFGVDLKGGNTTEPVGPANSSSNGVPPTASPSAAPAQAAASQKLVADLMRAKRSEVIVTLRARVLKVLPDDNDGSRHQKVLLSITTRNSPHDTVLIAHNIDLAPRVPVHEGDELIVHGQYEYNDRGGVIHWTHHDPGKRREGGWIEHAGQRYE